MTNRRPRGTPVSIQQRVHLFLRLYDELKKEPYAKNGEISISFTIGGSGEAISTNTQRQEFRSYIVLFRQFISPDDNCYIDTILRRLPMHVDDSALRARLSAAMDQWKAANGIWSPLAPLSLGAFASGRATADLYLNGGVFHSDLHLSEVWDAVGPDKQRFIEYHFRQYEAKVRLVVIELKKVIDEAKAGGLLRDDPLDLSHRDHRNRETASV